MSKLRNIITDPGQRPLIAPSILSADFANMGQDCKAVIDAGGDLLHLDVMDGHFVPNLTMGPALCESLRKALPDVFLDVHLMVSNPAIFVKSFADSGANHFTFHIETVPDPVKLADEVRAHGMTVGLAINPPTDVEAILPYISDFEMILVMSVNPGFSGQSFIDSVLGKVRLISPLLRRDQRLEMDGGVSLETVTSCCEAGCDILVAATAIFKSDNYAKAIADLRSACLSSSTF